MKPILFALFPLFMLSCIHDKDDNAYYEKRTGPVEIIETSIPDSAKSQDFIEIEAKASANNGCWRSLFVELKATDTFDHTIKAYGTYESYGACPDIMVYQDTVIHFGPLQKGTYIFAITKNQDEIAIDTMIVK
jgi:hypothetical protein